ncbi:protein sisterless A-like [Haematobia irritans]|uniref:protein sisterless A-like n=1 Tax=Haematobia irritans TaxID=7368 RepID=UPI003F4FAC3F
MTTEGLYLEDAWISLTQMHVQMQSITIGRHSQHISSQYIDQVVDVEIKRVKANCKREEDRFVEQMLLENPIVVERRNLSPLPQRTSSSPVVQSTQSVPTAALDSTPKTNDNNYQRHLLQQHSTGNGCSSNIGDSDRETNDKAAYERQMQQQQRAESCRRSRINNKIKKAKMKFRHKFMSKKLMQSIGMLECIQKLIDQTEMQLVSQGFSGQQLEKIKEQYHSAIL